jgi:hypothetical protein
MDDLLIIGSDDHRLAKQLQAHFDAPAYVREPAPSKRLWTSSWPAASGNAKNG